MVMRNLNEPNRYVFFDVDCKASSDFYSFESLVC